MTLPDTNRYWRGSEPERPEFVYEVELQISTPASLTSEARD